MNSKITIDLFLIVAIGSISIGIFFIIYFISSKKLISQNRNKILLYILIFFVLFIVYDYSVHSKLIYYIPWSFKFGRHLDLLIYMLLFFYFRSFKKSKIQSLKVVHWSLIIGFLFVLLIKSPWYHFSSVTTQHRILDMFYSDTRPGPSSIWRVWKIFLLKFALPLILLSLAGIQILRFVLPALKNKMIKHLLLLSFTVLFLFVLFSNWIYKKLYESTAISFIEWPIELLVLSFVQVILIFYAIKTYDLKDLSLKYEHSSLSDDGALENIEKLKLFMKNEKAYLNAELTLNEISDRLNVNTTYLSQAINSQLNLRFNDFLNNYRIEEAKKLLRDLEYHKYTIDTIAKKAGFKSLSPFYKAFRKHTGTSPSKFKKYNI